MAYSGVSIADRSRGLADERKVKNWLATSYKVVEATKDEQIFQDIDCWIVKGNQRTSVSIKSQVDGIRYRNYCLELISQQQNGIAWTPELVNKLYSIPNFSAEYPDVDLVTTTFRPSWFLFGKADAYLFLFQNKLVKLTSTELLSHCHKYGMDYYRRLGRERLAGQGGKDAASGYVYWDTLVRLGTPGKTVFLG